MKFSNAKDFSEIPTVTPTGAPNRGEVGTKRQFSTNMSRYISNTVQDRDIVTMERYCPLSIGAIFIDFE